MTFCFKGRFQIRSHCYNVRLRDKRLRWVSEESTIEESDSRCFGRAKSGTRAENERRGSGGKEREDSRHRTQRLWMYIAANLLKWWNPISFVAPNFGERQNAREKTRTREMRSTRYFEGRVEHVDFSRPSEFFFNIQTVTCLGITRWLVSSFWILQFRQIIILFTVARSRQIQ